MNFNCVSTLNFRYSIGKFLISRQNNNLRKTSSQLIPTRSIFFTRKCGAQKYFVEFLSFPISIFDENSAREHGVLQHLITGHMLEATLLKSRFSESDKKFQKITYLQVGDFFKFCDTLSIYLSTLQYIEWLALKWSQSHLGPLLLRTPHENHFSEHKFLGAYICWDPYFSGTKFLRALKRKGPK